jgi:uncharacterized protein (DUF4415 family)
VAGWGGILGGKAAGWRGWNAAGKRLENGWLFFRKVLTVSGEDPAVPDMVGESFSMEERLRTIAQERAHMAMMRELEALALDLRDWKLRQALIPKEWHAMDRTAPVRPRRTKVTLLLDTDLTKWYHGLGAGYHRRINAVLRTFMLALISKEILSQGDTNRHGEEIWGKAAGKKEG